MSNTGDKVTRRYGGFCGVDFRGDEVNLARSPDCLNVWRDYKDTDCIKTRPGLRLLTFYDDPVYGIFFHDDVMIVHCADSLYEGADKDEQGTLIYGGCNGRPSAFFSFGEVWYFLDGIQYLRNGVEAVETEAYVPTTTIGRRPAGGGEAFQDINYLTGERINTFLADGTSKDFFLDAQNIDSGYKPIVKVNDAIVTNFSVDYAKGKITFTTAPAAPKTDGQDNVSIRFCKVVDGYADVIRKCTICQVFDGRVFFSGNPDYPSTVYHCALENPAYFSDQDYYTEGLDRARIRSLVAGNNALWVFRERSDENTTIFYHNPVNDEDYGKIYPSVHSSISTGCKGRAINFNDDIVFFSDRGMEGISGDITTEQAVAHRSTLVDSRLLSEDGYEDMVFAEWEGYLLVFIGNKVYLADSRGLFQNGNHYEYEWFYWELEKNVRCATVHGGKLYLGTDDGVYVLDDYECDVESYWTTPKDKFGAPNKQKTTNKRGCIAEAEGDVSVYVRTDNGGFEHISDHGGITDSFVCRIKKKKWKDIQLKFHSMTRFRLDTVTLESFIGGYIKR